MSKEVENNQASLEDIGWERMEALLDKEMPLRRGFIWWWAFSGAAVVALVASIWVIQYDNSFVEAETISSTPQEGIASDGGVITDFGPTGRDVPNGSDAQVTNPAVGGVDKNLRGKVLPSQDQGEGRTTEKLKSAVANQPVVSNQLKQVTKSENLSPDNIDKVAMEADESNSKEAKGDKKMTYSPSSSSSYALPRSDVGTSEGQTEQKEHVKSDREVAFSTKKALFKNFAVLPTVFKIIDYTIPIEVPLTDIDVSQPILVRSSGKWNASLEIGGLVNASGQKFSWDAGASLGVQVAKNIAVSSGVYVWSIADNEDFSFVEDATFSDLQSANDVLAPEMPRFMDTVTFVSTDQSRWGQTRRLTYLRIPLYVHLTPQKRWSPYAGISYVRLLSNRTPQSADTDFVRVDQGSEITDLLRTSNVSLDLGITYRPLEHLCIDLSYLHGTKSYLNYTIGGNGVPAIHRTLRLSLGYQF